MSLIRPFNRSLTGTTLEAILRAVPVLLYMIVIYRFSALTGEEVPVVVDDRIVHFAEYFLFGALAMFAAAGFTTRGIAAGHAVAAATFGILFSLTDEWHQMSVPGRDPSIKDLAFDALGLIASCAAIYLLARRRENV